MTVNQIDKKIRDIKAKITKEQKKLREWERQKTELENSEILSAARAKAQEYNLSPEEIVNFIRGGKLPVSKENEEEFHENP